jgi:hypothetical protein
MITIAVSVVASTSDFSPILKASAVVGKERATPHRPWRPSWRVGEIRRRHVARQPNGTLAGRSDSLPASRA